MNVFYKLGGDSLNDIHIYSKISKELNVKIYLKYVMSHSMIYDLGKYIEGIINYNSDKMKIIEKRNSREFPVTSQQLRVYIESFLRPNDIIYNILEMIKLTKNVNISKIKEEFNKLFEKQEILKSKYYEKEMNGKFEIYRR